MDPMSEASDHVRPVRLDLERVRGLHIEWSDGRSHFLSVQVLRRHSPSAEQRELRAALERNPFTVLPASRAEGPLEASALEAVGHYAVRIRFNDGHHTGIYTWGYLRELAEAHGVAVDGPAASGG